MASAKDPANCEITGISRVVPTRNTTYLFRQGTVGKTPSRDDGNVCITGGASNVTNAGPLNGLALDAVFSANSLYTLELVISLAYVSRYAVNDFGEWSTSLQSISAGNSLSQIALTPNGKFLLVSNNSANNIQIFRISDDGSINTSALDSQLFNQPTSLAVDPLGRGFFAVGGGGTALLQKGITSAGTFAEIPPNLTGGFSTIPTAYYAVQVIPTY